MEWFNFFLKKKKLVDNNVNKLPSAKKRASFESPVVGRILEVFLSTFFVASDEITVSLVLSVVLSVISPLVFVLSLFAIFS